MNRLGSSAIVRPRRALAGASWLCVAGVLVAAVCGGPEGAVSARDDRAVGAPATGPTTSPASAAASVYRTLAVVASPGVRKPGLADLVAAEVARIPGVRMVEREHLDAAAGELAAATLLGGDAGAGAARLKLGRLVRADALLVLAEEEGASGPGAVNRQGDGQPAPGGGGAGDEASDLPAEVQMVIADCRQGTRLRVLHLPVDPRDLPRLTGATAAAVREVQARYPDGVRWIVGTSPFVSRNLLHDDDPDQRRFAAVLDNALSLQPGVAVLESQEARAIAAERAVGVDDNATRTVPLIVEGAFEVRRRATAPTTGPAAGDRDKDATVRFTIKLADARGTAKTIEREVPLGDAGRFLGADLPADILRLAPLPDQKPLPPEAQFRTLVARADEFARLNAFEHSTPLREAALLVAPARDRAATDQHRLLVREYTGLTQRPVFGRMTPQERAARERAMRDEARELSLQHVEYLVRNRLVNRHEALERLTDTRRYLGVVVADGPPRWTQLLSDLYPIVWSLPRAPKNTNGDPSPAVIDKEDRGFWVRLVISSENANRLSWSGGHVMTPAAYDTVMRVVEQFGDVEPYPTWEIAGPMGYMPRFPVASPGSFSFIYGPGERPKDAGLSNEEIDKQYDAFLTRLQNCSKPGYTFLARHRRLRQRHARALNTELPATAEEMEQAGREFESLEADYRRLRLGGAPPGEDDLLLMWLADARKSLASAAELRKTHGRPAVAKAEAARAPTTYPSTMPTLPGVAPAVNRGNRLWFVPVPIQEKLPRSGELRPYGEIYARETNGYWNEHLLPCGDGLDVLWRSNVVKFLRDGVLEAVLVNDADPLAAQISDVRWDGKRVWVVRKQKGLWVFDTRGREVARIGEAEGLPPVSGFGQLFVEPLADDRVFVAGSFAQGWPRLWCAIITTEFGPNGLTRPPRVEVVHKAMAMMTPSTAVTRPSTRPVAPDIAFNPSWIGQLTRQTALSEPAGHAGPFILLAVSGAPRRLVLDLSNPTATKASVWFAPRPRFRSDRGDYRGMPGSYDDFVWAGSPWVFAVSGDECTLYRAEFLARRKDAPAGDAKVAAALNVEFSEGYEPVYARPDPRKGVHPLDGGPRGDVIGTPDALYLPGGDAWIKIDAKTLAAEWLALDEPVNRAGDLGRLGLSTQYGLVAWGKEFCRLVVARERPPGAMEVKTVKGVGGDDIQVLWAGGRPTPSAEQLTGAGKPAWGTGNRDRPVAQTSAAPAPAPPVSVKPATPTTGSIVATEAAPRAAAVHVLALNAEEPREGGGARAGLLARELARQAILIAARDELGWATRDQTLQEPFPPGAVELDVGTFMPPGKPMEVWAHRRGPAGGGGVVAIADANGEPDLIDTAVRAGKKEESPPDTAVDYVPDVAGLERLSRTVFVDALKKAGLQGSANARRPDVPVPDSVEKHLADWSFVAQFAAVREAHATIRRQGESPALLGALVRGYANLSLVTDVLWNASHKAFAARSLLYAERMVAADPASADARYHRAYARGLAGLHATALADLDEADRMSAKSGRKPPAWAGLIRAYCRYDTKALADAMVADAAQAQLAGHLCFTTVRHCPSQSYIIELGQAVMQVDPACLDVLERMNRVAGVSAGHSLSALGPGVLAQALAAKLPGIAGLPADVRQAVPRDPRGLTQPAAAAEFASRLVKAGSDVAADTDEPSWAALGRMVQEHQFVHVLRRAVFLVEWLNVDADDFVAEARPLVAEHPYRRLIEAYAINAERDPQAVAAALKEVPLFDAEDQESLILHRLRAAGPSQEPRRNQIYGQMLHHMDDVARDLEANLSDWHATSPPDDTIRYLLGVARRAEAVSPHMPEVVATRVHVDWKAVEPNAGQIERDYGHHLAVSYALGMQHVRLKRYADAERVLRRYVERGHDVNVYRTLARCQLAGGDEAGWLKTLEECLRQEDYGLSHARVRVAISQHLMSQGKYDRAEPYAREAAETWASWAMINAADCYEGLARWDEAEQWVRRDAERYDRPMAWYVWCVRTGHGDERAAAAVASDYVRRAARATDQNAVGNRALFYLLQGRSADALSLYQQQLDQLGSPFDGLHAALLHEAAHDAAARDAALDAVVRRGPAYRDQIDGRPRPHFVALAGLFRQALAEPGGGGKVDAKSVEALLAPLGSGDRLNTLYFIARFEDLRGHAAEATDYYRRCAAIRDAHKTNRVLAIRELRKRGVEVKVPPPDDPEKQQGTD